MSKRVEAASNVAEAFGLGMKKVFSMDEGLERMILKQSRTKWQLMHSISEKFVLSILSLCSLFSTRSKIDCFNLSVCGLSFTMPRDMGDLRKILLEVRACRQHACMHGLGEEFPFVQRSQITKLCNMVN